MTPTNPALLQQQQNQVTFSNTNPRYGQYLTHAHSHITRAVAAMDSCLWHSRRVEIGLKALCSLPFTAEKGGKHPFTRQLHTTHAETAAHGCHFPGDMAVRMRKVLARPWVGVRVCRLLLLLFLLQQDFTLKINLPCYFLLPGATNHSFNN